MRRGSQNTSGIERLPDGRTKAYAYAEASPEMKREIMGRVPEEMRQCITATVKEFGRLHYIGVKWRG